MLIKVHRPVISQHWTVCWMFPIHSVLVETFNWVHNSHSMKTMDIFTDSMAIPLTVVKRFQSFMYSLKKESFIFYWPCRPALLCLLRFSTGLQWASAGALSSRHLPLCHHLPGLPDEAKAGTFGRSVRVCTAAPQHHLPQLQLHGPTAAVRVAAPRHLVRRRSRRHGKPAARTQDHDNHHLNGSHAHLAVHFQLPSFCCEPCLPAPQHHHDLPPLLIDRQSKPSLNTKRAQTGAAAGSML